MAVIDTLITSALNSVVKLAGVVIGTRRGINFIQGTNVTLTVADDAANNAVNVTIGSTAVSAPTGAITQYAAAAAPSGWLLCDGAAVSRTTQAALFGIIGTLYGVGDGTTTFNVPDMRGRMPVGFAAAGGHADVSTLGANPGGALATRTPNHTHDTTVTSNRTDGSATNPGTEFVATQTNTSSAGSAPYLVVNHIIKT